MTRFAKVIRDPIYGYVGITKQQLGIIELPVFQRLRRVTQLSFCNLVYPDASHTRFAHSLGTMNLSRIVSQYLKISGIGKQAHLTNKDYKAIEWTGLLHDVGHLPFSHVSEPAFAYFIGSTDDWKDYHVKIGIEILQNREFGINKKVPSAILQKVIALIDKDSNEICSLLKEVIGGVCSIDRLDYLRRDAHHAGTPEYAIVDHERILTSITHFPNDPYLAPIFRKKALYALEGAILSYFYMYRAIYYHHAVRAAYLLFQDIIWDAFEKYNLNADVQELYEPECWNYLDDHKFLSLLYSKDELRSKLNQLVFRKLPKEVKGISTANVGRILRLLGEKVCYKRKVSEERKIVGAMKGKYPTTEMIFLDSPLVIPYPRSLFAERGLYIWDEKRDTEPQNIGQEAPYLPALANASEQQLAARVYVYPGDLREDKKFVEDLNSTIANVLK